MLSHSQVFTVFILMLTVPSAVPQQYQQEPRKPYSFQWEVQDPATGNDYGHFEQSDGNTVQGEYRTLLPDGRIQTVSYVDNGNGFEAQVQYQGEAQYPQPIGGYQKRTIDEGGPEIPQPVIPKAPTDHEEAAQSLRQYTQGYQKRNTNAQQVPTNYEQTALNLRQNFQGYQKRNTNAQRIQKLPINYEEEAQNLRQGSQKQNTNTEKIPTKYDEAQSYSEEYQKRNVNTQIIPPRKHRQANKKLQQYSQSNTNTHQIPKPPSNQGDSAWNQQQYPQQYYQSNGSTQKTPKTTPNYQDTYYNPQQQPIADTPTDYSEVAKTLQEFSKPLRGYHPRTTSRRQQRILPLDNQNEVEPVNEHKQQRLNNKSS